jgi:hypothetical protein
MSIVHNIEGCLFLRWICVILVVGLLCRPTPTEYRLPTHCVGSVWAGHTLARPIWGRQGH